MKEPKTTFLGINFAIASLLTYLSITEDIKEPRSRNGKLSKKIEINIIEIFFIISIIFSLSLRMKLF